MRSVIKKGKRFLALVLTLAMCLGLCTVQVSAAEMRSSELSNFTNQVMIKDSSGEIPDGGMLHVGSTYAVALSFKEDNYVGTEKQFEANDAGQLTYQLPAQLKAKPVEGKPIPLDGRDIAYYSITQDGFVTVDFINIPNPEGEGEIILFDGYNNTAFNIQFECTVAAGTTEGEQVLNFGNGKTFNVNITSDGDLKIKKEAGEYDGEKGTIDYTVMVAAVNGTVSNIMLEDVITSGNAAIVGSGSFYGPDGSELPSQPTSLSAGEYFFWKYSVKVNASAFNTTAKDGRVQIDNTATVTGETNGKKISKPASKTTHINYKNFKKESVSIDTDEQTITWKIELGDGNRPLSDIFGREAVITETLSDAGLYSQAFEPQYVKVTYTDKNGDETPDEILWTGSSTLRIPTNGAYGAVFEFKSSYTEKDLSKVGPAKFINTAEVATTGGNITDSAYITKGKEGLGKPDLKKESEKNDAGNAVHYTITAKIPGGYENVPGFYIVDTISSIGTTTFSNDPKNIVVSAVPVDGTESDRVYFTKDETKSGPNTFFTVNEGGKNEILITFFNTTSSDKDESTWTFDEDMILTVEYDLPLDAVSGGVTVQEALDKGGVLSNTAQLYYNNGSKIEDGDTYSEVSESEKKGVYDSNTDVIDYTYTFFNVYMGVQAIDTAQADKLVFTDTLGSGMEFADGPLYLEFYDGNTLQAAYEYTESIGGRTSISVSTDDFVPVKGTTTTIDKFLGEGYNIKYTDSIVYRYQAKVDRESTKFTDPGAGTDVTLSNTADLDIRKDGDSVKKPETRTADVKVPNNKVNKFMSGLHDEDRVSFTIELNYAGEDLIKGADTYTVEDTLSSNIYPLLNTVEIQIMEDGKWTSYDGDYSFDNKNNVQEFTVPDSVPVKITYDVKVTETGSDVEIKNDVAVKGQAQFADQTRAVFDVQKSDASASASKTDFNLYKYDADTNIGLANAVFAMYGPEFADRQGNAVGDSEKYGEDIPKTVKVTTNGTEKTLHYYRCYETDDIGVSQISSTNMSVGGLYSFKEIKAPQGYVKSDDLTTIYAFEYPGEDKDLDIQVIKGDENLFIANEAEEVPDEPAGNLKITKTIKGDVTEDEAEGALQFRVTGPDEFDEIYTLADFEHDEDTKVYILELEDIEPGEYTVVETVYNITGKAVTVKYSIDTGDFREGTSADLDVVENETVEIEFEDDYLDLGGLKITKTINGNVTKEEAEGALKFKVTGPDSYEETFTLEDFEHDTDTNLYTLELDDLKPGKYTVEETAYDITGKSVTVKYAVDSSVYTVGKSAKATVVKDETVDVAFEDDYSNKVGNIRITKTIKGEVTEEEAEGAIEFTVTDPDGYEEVYTLDKFDHVKGSNVYTLELSGKPGKYTVEETAYYLEGKSVTVRYSINGGTAAANTAADITVIEDQTVKVAYEDNYKTNDKTHLVLINKVDDLGIGLNGAKLTVNGIGVHSGKVGPIRWTTDTNKDPFGHVLMLEAGKYILTENQAPKGYLKAKSIEFTVTESGKIMIGGKEVSEVEMVDKFSYFAYLLGDDIDWNIFGDDIDWDWFDVDTGDNTNAAPFAALLAVSGIALAGIAVFAVSRRRRNSDRG